MFSDDIIISSFILTLKFIIRFIINKIFKFAFITKLFEISKLYQNLISNFLVLLIKIVFIEFYKSRIFKKIIMDFYRKIY